MEGGKPVEAERYWIVPRIMFLHQQVARMIMLLLSIARHKKSGTFTGFLSPNCLS